MYVSAEKLRNINGPVYLTEESDHHNGEFIKAVDTDAKDLTGPVYMSKDSGRNVLDKIYERALKVKELVEFGSNIGVAFRELRKIKDFCDVTLA